MVARRRRHFTLAHRLGCRVTWIVRRTPTSQFDNLRRRSPSSRAVVLVRHSTLTNPLAPSRFRHPLSYRFPLKILKISQAAQGCQRAPSTQKAHKLCCVLFSSLCPKLKTFRRSPPKLNVRQNLHIVSQFFPPDDQTSRRVMT